MLRAVDAATLEAAKSAQDLAVEAVPAKEAAVREAEAVVKKAEIILGMYEIRSPVRGVVKAILKHRGEAVKSLETVVEIQETAQGIRSITNNVSLQWEDAGSHGAADGDRGGCRFADSVESGNAASARRRIRSGQAAADEVPTAEVSQPSGKAELR